MKEKLIIYQLFPRIFTNMNANCQKNGTLQENGCGKLNEITEKTIKSIADLGVNCLWMTGIIEMATKSEFEGIPADNPNIIKGEAGSPYAIKDYYDIAPSLAEDTSRRMEEFEALIDRVHRQGLKLLIDFVPNHTARVYHSDSAPDGIKDFGSEDNTNMFFDPQNNYYYIQNQQFYPDFDLGLEGNENYVEFPAKATGNDCYTAFCSRNDWYETVKLNYGYDPWCGRVRDEVLPDTWKKMLDILLFWASKGVDGFRCDMVFMVPQEFWHWVIPQVKAHYPEVLFIGEIYDIGLYRPFLDYCHFDYLYDKVNLYDTLVGIECHNFSAAQLTLCWQRIDGLGDKMLNFLENHDEVRFASKEYAKEASRVIPSLVVSSMISKGPFMVYYGQELGEPADENEGFAGDNNRTTIFDYWSLERMRRWYDHGKCSTKKLHANERHLREIYKKVLRLCNERSSIRAGSFFDLTYANQNNDSFDMHKQFAFVRYDDKEALLIVANFSDYAKDMKVVIPELAFDMVQLKRDSYLTKDILNGKSIEVELGVESSLHFTIDRNNAVIIPLKVEKK